MKDYIFLMHDDVKELTKPEAWGVYLAKLSGTGRFQGGSSIGGGACFNKEGRAAAVTKHVGGYLRVQAESLEQARELLEGNPVFECGGTVEIRELPKD